LLRGKQIGKEMEKSGKQERRGKRKWEKERKICKVKGKANRKVKLQQIGMKTKQKEIEFKRK